MPETAKRTARVPILGEDGRISDDYIPAAIGEGVESAEAAATRAETAATAAEGSATAAGQSAASAQGSASAAGASAAQAQESATAASGAATKAQSAQQAAEAAKTAAETAQSAAAGSAQSAQQSATAAASSAASVADKFIASAQATTLEPGSQATASVADQVLTIGVPKGEKGDKGDQGDPGQDGTNGTDGVTPFTQATVTTLEPDSPATVAIEEDTLKLGIPKGVKGDKGDTGDQGPQGEPGQDGQDATLPEGMVTADDSGVLSRLGSDGEPSVMTDVVVGNTANGTSATMRTSTNSPSVSVMNSQTGAGVGFGLIDGEPVLSAGKSQSDEKVYGFSPTIPEDDALTVVTSDAYKADTDPLKQRISELEQQTQNVVTGTSTGLVSHGEDAFPQKPREVRIKGKTWVNRWPVIKGTNNGITVSTDETGLVTVTGTATADADVTADVSGWAAGKSYTTMVSATPTGCSAYFEVQKPSGNTSINATTTGATLNVASDATNCVAGVRVASGTTVNASFRVMLVDGTEAPDCFTPCASITSVQAGNLVTAGKNLVACVGIGRTISSVSETFTSEGITWTLNDDGSITRVGTATANTYCYIVPFDDYSLPAGTYTLTGVSVQFVGAGNMTGPVVELEHGDLITDFFIEVRQGTQVDDTVYPQLELGSTATAYEPPTVTTTPLPEVELRSLPNGTCDELVIRADGTCEVERKLREVVVDAEHPAIVGSVVPASGDKLPYAIVGNLVPPFASPTAEPYSTEMHSTTWPYDFSLSRRGVYRTSQSIMFVDERFTDKETAQSIINETGGTFVAQVPSSTEPQSPVTLPALPAPTFNQYHDSPVPSDTSTEYARDINLVLANLESVQAALLGGE